MATRRKDNGYGEAVAREYARKAEERRALATAPRPKARKAAKPLDVYPLDSYTYRHTQDSIDWSNPFTSSLAADLSKRLGSGDSLMQMLVMGTGLGKTAAAVSTMGAIARENGRVDFVVVAPPAVVSGGGWQETICSWNAANPDVPLKPYAVTTFEKFANAVADPKQKVAIMRDLPADAILVLDEVHAYKNPTSKRSKQMQKLTRYRRLGLTATPLTNDVVMDAASYLILAGKYRNKTHFMQETGLDMYVDEFHRLPMYVRGPKGAMVLNGPLWERFVEIRAELADVMYQPDVETVDAEMPNVRDVVVQLPFSDSLDADMMSLSSAYRKRMFESATQLSLAMCERVCADPVRLGRCVSICSDPSVRQPLVFFWHKSTADVLTAAFSDAGMLVQILDGGHHMSDIDHSVTGPILVQYQAGATGVEFKNSNTSVFYENQYSYSCLQQAKGRNVRRGGKEQVTRYSLVSSTMFDQEVFARVADKEELNEESLAAIAEASLQDGGAV